MKNNIKNELIIALKYVCPKLGYGFLGLGIALCVTQPGKMADILFSSRGNGLLGFTLGAILFYVICDIRRSKKIEKLEAENKKLNEDNEKLKTHNQNLRKIIANGGNRKAKAHSTAQVAVPIEPPSTQPRKLFDFEAEYEDSSVEEEPVEEAVEEPAEEVADEQIPEPAEEEKSDLQESSES